MAALGTPSLSMIDEGRLATGLIAQDAEAISLFLERVHHPVFCMACRLTLDRDLRQDWAHEALLGILEDLRLGRFAFRGPGCFWAWFRKRAYFRLLDQCRLHRRHLQRETPAEDLGGGLGIDALPGGEDPEAEIARAETWAALEHCLDGLRNVDHRKALELLLLEDLSYQEIAERMRTPLNTARAWIRRGRLALRLCLTRRLNLEGEGAVRG